VTFDHEVYAPLSAELVLMEGARMIDEWPILEKKIPNFTVVFQRVAGAVPRRPAVGVSSKAALDDLISIIDDEPGAVAAARGEALGPRENAVLALVDGVRSVQEVIDVAGLGEFETCRCSWADLAEPIRLREPRAPSARRPQGPRQEGRLGEYAVIAAAVFVALVAFLFNPWGIVAQGFRARQGQLESAALADAVRLRRVRFALEVFFLEKQSYPASLESLVESGLLRARELRGAAGSRFAYRAAGREYQLDREAAP
jgi:hypothetical protein